MILMISHIWIFLSFLSFVAVSSLTVSARAERGDFDSELRVAPSSEAARLSAYATHRDLKTQFDRERERGLSEYLEEIEKHNLLRDRALDEFKREKKVSSPAEFGPEYEQDLVTKRRFQSHFDEAEQEDFNRRAREGVKKAQARKILSEEVELEIYSHRPRYAFNRRALYGAKPKWGESARKSGSGFSGSGDSTNIRSGSDSFMPPTSNPAPIPPPPMDPTPFDDFPPPPPPPPMPMDGGGFDDFPPPPPPPMEDFGF